MSVPVCPVCCETLGCYGGPTTLPCGHNGCLNCMEACQSRRSECPLCRAQFGGHKLTVNRQLRDLVAVASRLEIDEQSREEGWEAFPSPRVASKHYTSELRSTADKEPPPSAPPLQGSDSLMTDVLSFTPPVWIPDSASTECMACRSAFKMVTRPRHHCRLCGKLFCSKCCNKRMLLPPSFNTREPERVCELCADVLAPCQPHLAATLSVAAQPPVHDVIDGTSIRSFVNNPFSKSLADDIYKAANILHTFRKLVALFPKVVKMEEIENAAGVAIISEAKIGFGFWSSKIGSGLVVSRGQSGAWSPPCAISSTGAGWGLQAGGEIMDVIIILPDKNAVDAFTGGIGRITFGGSVGMALGVGGARKAEAVIKVGEKSSAKCFSYGMSRGAFMGVSIEGSVIGTRDGINHNFYGLPVSSTELLSGTTVVPPLGAAVLYKALSEVFGGHCCSLDTLEDMAEETSSVVLSGEQQDGGVCHQEHSLHESTHEDLRTSRDSMGIYMPDRGDMEEEEHFNGSNGFHHMQVEDMGSDYQSEFPTVPTSIHTRNISEGDDFDGTIPVEML